MTTYSETFLCSAYPTDVSGTTLTLSILISPRLGSDDADGTRAPLSNWPDAANLPNLEPTWEIEIVDSAGTSTGPLAATETSGPYDDAFWSHIFPPAALVTPHAPADRSAAPVASYSSSTIRDGAKGLHVQVLGSSRNAPPSVQDVLLQGEVFPKLVKAADPNSIRDALNGGDDGDPLVRALVNAWLFHGARMQPGTAITSVSPAGEPTAGTNEDYPGGEVPVTISGTGFRSGATVAFVFTGYSATPSDPVTPFPSPQPELSAGHVVVNSATEITCTSPPITDEVIANSSVTLYAVVQVRVGGVAVESPTTYRYVLSAHIK